MTTKVVFITSGTTFVVPADWNSANNTIECIGGGAGAFKGKSGTYDVGAGGGAYAKSVNQTLTPSATVNINIGTGGAGSTTANTAGANGGDTWIASNMTATVITSTGVVAGAKGGTCTATSSGTAASQTSPGGASASCIALGPGAVAFSGGAGHTTGGGGAGGPNGVGGAGGFGSGVTNAANYGGGGGGSGGGAGGIALIGGGTATGGGGNNSSGSGGGAAGVGSNANGSNGTNGGGGGAGSGSGRGGNGGNGIEWTATAGGTAGSGGGGAGAGAGGLAIGTNIGGNGGLYGAGGAGGFVGATQGSGAQGIIVLTYVVGGIDDTLSDSISTSDVYNSTLVYTNSLSDSITTSDTYSGIITQSFPFSDSVITSDSYSGTIAFNSTLSDTTTTSELYTSILSPVSVNLSDSIATSDSYDMSFLVTLSDTISTADSYDAAVTGDPLHEFDGVVRETLLTGGSSSEILADGVIRETLYSSGNSPGIPIFVDGVVREVLVANNYNFINIPSPLNYGPVPIFPSLPEGFPVTISPVLDTTIGTTKSLREMRVAQQVYPLWDIELVFEELRDRTQNEVPDPSMANYTQYMELAQLFIMMYGQSGVFAFDCPWDNSRSNQLIGQGDGQSYIFNIYRTFGIGQTATTDPVGMVNEVFDVKVDGITIPSNHYNIIRDKIYFIDSLGFVYPPGNALNITMTFSYYYLCRFTEDEQNFEEFFANRWTVPSIKFRAVIWQ